MKETQSPKMPLSHKSLPQEEIDQLFVLFNTGRHVELEKRTRLLLERYPDSGIAWKVLSVSLSVQGKDGLIALQKATEYLPDDVEAYSNLGTALLNLGRIDDAVASYRRALEIKPDYAEANNNFGNVLRYLGRFEDAVASCRRALKIKPNYAEAHNNLGNALQDRGQRDDAVASYLRALEIKPDYAEANNNLGNALQERGQIDDAAARYRRVLEVKPDYAEAHNNLGNALQERGQIGDALACYRWALEIKPVYAEAHNNLGDALQDLGQLDDAVASFRRALEIKPDYAEAHNNLGNALRDLGQPDNAVASCRRALETKADYAEAINNLGNALKDLGQLDDAVASYRRVLEIKPDYAEAHFNLGMLLLYLGEFEEGWKHYEFRNSQTNVNRSSTPPDVGFPQWRGQPLAGKSLLVWYEQGLGDQIQFYRYLPILKAQGASRIVLVCQAPLKALFERFAGADELLTSAEAVNIPAQDYWTFPLSIPLHSGTTIENIPSSIPYLYASEMIAQDMAMRLAHIEEFTVGICWQGSNISRVASDRSPGIEPFKKLFGLAGVRFFTLQPDSRDEFLMTAGEASVDLGHEIDSLGPPFEETAALIMNLDLVITCDTSIGHLAGALGKTVWVLLPFVPHWIWMEEREDSPWYPNTRLFRQTRRGDWNDVFDRVVARLKSVIAGESPSLWSVSKTQGTEISRSTVGIIVRAPISVGELLDKITILEIKALRINDVAKQANVTRELSELRAMTKSSLGLNAEGQKIVDELRQVNNLLWNVEDGIRECESNKDFGTRFVELARSVYRYNDQRAQLKKQLNELTGSELIEEKSYSSARGEHCSNENVEVNLYMANSNMGTENSATAFNHLVETKYGHMLCNRNDVYIGASLTAYGEWSEGESLMFTHLVTAGHVVVEAGANVGSHTIHLARLVGLGGVIYAFEPQRIVFQTLCANLALNQCINVVTRQQGLGSKFGEMVLPNVDPRMQYNFAGVSLLETGAGEKVGVVTIDSLNLIRCDLIKADVEGMEQEVIEGAINTITRFRPILYLENDRVERSPSLVRLLQSLGYRMWWHLPPLFNPDNYAKNPTNIFGNIISINIVCLPAESAKPQFNLREIRNPEDRLA